MNQVTIENNYISLTVLDYGAIIQKLRIKTPEGTFIDGVLGHDNPKDYINDPFFLGACIGRYAGRISNNGFALKGKKYKLNTENGVHLHGGTNGFSKKYWTIKEIVHTASPYISLSYKSPHLEEGYPGNLNVLITYKLVNNELHVIHEARTDKTTIVNLTNHSYFSLDTGSDVAHYQLKLQCPQVLETDKRLLPTGKRLSVKDSEMDFLGGKEIGNTLLDTPFVFKAIDEKMICAFSEKSGVFMEVKTNQPSVVIYTPKNLGGICFETQNFPDAPNHSHFPSSVLHPEETYNNTSIFKFGFIH